MKVKYVLQMEIDDVFAIDDETGEKLTGDDLILRLEEAITDGMPIDIDEITSVEVTE